MSLIPAILKKNGSFALLTILFALFSVLTGCHNHDHAESKMDLLLHESIMDSLQRLDSLTSRLRLSDNKLAVSFARRSLRLAQKQNYPEALVTAYNSLANALHERRKDSSYYYYTVAFRLADSCHLNAKKPMLFFNLAMLNVDAANLKMATSLLDSSITLAEKHSQTGMLADAYNSLGLIKLASSDSSGAKQSYEKALEIGKKNHLPRQCGTALANLSLFESNPVALTRLLYKAMQYYQGLPGLEEEKAQISINLGNNQRVPDSAIYFYNTALVIAERGGLNNIVIAAYNNLAYAYLDKKDIRKAENCMEAALPVALKQADADWLATLYDTYADVLIEKGDIGKALTCQKKAYRNRTESDYIKSIGQVRLLSAILDMRSKDTQIRQKEADLLAKMNENRILKAVIATFFIAMVALLFILLWFRQRARLIKIQEQMSAATRIIELEEMEKHRLGFELHDHVGFLVRSIDQFIRDYKFSDETDKEQILEKISNLRISIRRFTHRLNPVNVQHENFPDLMGDLIKDFSTLSGIRVKYFIPAYFPELPQKQLLHLIRIVQELMTNASKHADGSNVTINMAVTDQTLIMIYQDDGPGFDANLQDSKRFGFQSMEERVRLMEGKYTLTSQPGAGTKWEFLIPLAKQH